MKNLPAVSDENCMKNYPEARANERDCLIEKVEIKQGDAVLDIQAAAGYLSDKIANNLDWQVSCYCLEPSEIHRNRLNEKHIPIPNSVEHFPDIRTASIDVAVGLAGLHHSNCHQSTMNEVARVLKPNGQFAICDVVKDSNIAAWLNEYVDKHTPTGHQGNFVELGTLKQQCENAGFIEVTEKVESVPWYFPSEEVLVSFFKGLFGLTSSLAEVQDAIHHYFDIIVEPQRVTVPWQLLYVSGYKAQ